MWNCDFTDRNLLRCGIMGELGLYFELERKHMDLPFTTFLRELERSWEGVAYKLRRFRQ